MKSLLAVVLLGAAAACTDAPSPPGKPSLKVPVPGRNESPRATAGLRRLSLPELEQESRRLTGLEKSTAGMLVDQRVDGYDNDSDTLQISEARIDDVMAHAEHLAKVLVAQSPACAEELKPSECAHQVIDRTAERAWGRVPTAEEKGRLHAVYGSNVEASAHQHALELALQAVVLSPHFLYRSELGRGDGRRRLERWETAAAISFFLTGERPDDELLQASHRGDLETPDGREEQARRLLHTPKGEATLHRFFRAWLGLSHLDMLPKDTIVFPEFNAQLRTSMAAELDAYVSRKVLEENRTFAELMTDPLPAFAGVEALYADPMNLGPSFQRERRGLLSIPAVLAGHSPTEATSPTRRGLFVRTRLFCKGIAPPPPGALNNPPDLRNRDTTTREKFEQHAKDGRCAGCHALMDPIGFGLETFDSIGRHRLVDNGHLVNDVGALNGTDVDGVFRGPAQLGDKVAQSAQALDCFQQNLVRFALGRHARFARSGASGLGLESLIVDLVRDDGFVTRDAPEVTP